MSVINKMLQDLDRRQALGGATEGALVRPSTGGKAAGHEWFWRVLAVLLAAALAWMGWVAFQVMPRMPLATDLAHQVAAEARARSVAKPAVPANPPAVAAPAAAAAPLAEPTPAGEALKLALQLETPVKESAEPAPARPEPAKAPAARVETPKPAAAAPAKARAAPAPPPAAKALVNKRDRTRSASDQAETYFRRAALLLNHGRVSEAEEQLIAALQADPSHVPARQAYVALLLEQRRSDVARRLLHDAVAQNPGQATFALALARIHTEQGDYLAALDVMDRAGSVARNADFQALRGAALQRLGRHGDAVEAYQNALRGGAQPATTWVSYGISLEAIGRRAEAAQAYRRALASGPIAPEAREYAESRARALD